MNIRRIQINDVPQVLTCNVCNLPENYPARYWTYSLLSWPDLSYLVEDERGKVVGYVLSSIEPAEDDPHTQIGHVNSLSVLRPYRRRGLAQKLMNLTQAAMAQEDSRVQYIQLHVRKSNRAAISLYTKLGYQLHQVAQKYYVNGEDALIMRLPTQSKNPEHKEGPRKHSRKTWFASLWHFLYNGTHQFVEATMTLLRRNSPK